jgi:plasmid stabilization system protein ParE
MKAELIATAPFAADIRSQVEWLRAQGRSSWVDQLRQELEEAYVLLQEFPRAGVATDVRGRKLVLKKLPFAIRYVLEADDTKVVLLSLTHGRLRSRR